MLENQGVMTIEKKAEMLVGWVTYWGEEWAGGWPSGRSSTCEGEWSFRHCQDRGKESWRSC